MQYNIRTNKNFTTQYNKLQAEFGTDMARLNGFDDRQLSLTDFVDNFIGEPTVADSSIDGNSNVRRKDIVTLLSEMPKPHRKLLAFNKIYYEYQKVYGFKAANEWLRREWMGQLYMHDADTATFKHYCILPTECCEFLYNGRVIYASFEQLYKLLPEKEFLDEQQMVYYKKPKNLKVADLDTETRKKRYTKVTLISNKETDKDLYFIKAKNGFNLITTEDHSFITVNGEIHAEDLSKEDILYSNYSEDIFTNSLDEYAGLELTSNLGYIIGMYLAEGYNDRGQMNICQNKNKSPKEWDNIISTLEKIGIPYSVDEQRGRIRLKNGENDWERKMFKILYGKYANEKSLCPDFIHFNNDFLKGILCGIIDGDGTVSENRTLMIRLSSKTLINQIHLLGLHFGVYFGSRIPYIQNQEGCIKQKQPMYSAAINMNKSRDFFLSLPCRKIKENFTHFNYDEKYADNNYICKTGEIGVRDVCKTYKNTNKVFDISTESHTFLCNGLLVHNCFAYDLKDLAEKGLYFLEDTFNNKPPKHLTTFVDFVKEFINFASNRSSGEFAAPICFFSAYQQGRICG